MHHDDYDDYLAAAIVGAEGDRRPSGPRCCITTLIGLALMAFAIYWQVMRWLHH